MLWIATILGLAAEPATQTPPVFESRVEMVYVDAAVTRDGEPLTGLQARHFTLKDNGVLQEVELVAAESLPLEVQLVCDASASLTPKGRDELRSAAQALVMRLRAGDQATLLSFSEHLRLQAMSSRESVDTAVQSLAVGVRTALRDATYAALALAPSGRRSLVVVLTDGRDNASWVDAGDLARAAEVSNATLHFVISNPEGASDDSETEPLRQVAERTGGRLWRASEFSGIAPAVQAIVEALRHRYLLRYEPKGGSGPGLHRIDLRLRGAKGKVLVRRGYFRSR